MRSRAAVLLTCTLCICFATLRATAQSDIYDNGPTNGTADAWTLNFGFEVSNTFPITSDGVQVNGLNIAVWIIPGDVMESAEVSMTSEEFGGTTYFDQAVNFSQSGCVGNQYGYNVCTESSAFNGPTLNAGTYWLNLQNAVVNTGDPVYWDENGGPSWASNNTVGSLPSESFTLLGGGGSGTGTGPGSTPEPTSLVLFASGILGAVGLLRRKF